MLVTKETVWRSVKTNKGVELAELHNYAACVRDSCGLLHISEGNQCHKRLFIEYNVCPEWKPNAQN